LASHDRNLLGVITVGCNCCGLVQTNPRPSVAGLDTFYRDHYRFFYQGATEPDQVYITSLNKDHRLAYTAEFFLQTLALSLDAAVLDFGCGEGSLFAALRKAGFIGNFYGVELNSSFGEYASKYGDATVSSAIHSREQVDLAVVNHVLEHLHDPIGTLREIRKLIKPNGYIYVDVPDAEEYGSIYDLHIAHIYHFTERTLKQIVQQAGFLVTRVEKHHPPHHPKSIRLVASPMSAEHPEDVHLPDSEIVAWGVVRDAGRYRNTIRLRLRQIGWLRKAYVAVKRACI
jgi:SAM-dependent methyltransferase